MDLKAAYILVLEIDRTTAMLTARLSGQASTEPDDRIAAAEALRWLQQDRKMLVAEILKGAYGAKI